MKFVLLTLSAMLASTIAFVPILNTPQSSSTKLNAESFDDLKAIARKSNPVVDYFDPMNLATFEGGFWDQGQEATIGFLRQSEIKHGRVAMAAFVGYIVHAQGITWPFPQGLDGAAWPKLASVGSVPALWDALPELSKWQIILAIGALEFWDEYQFEGIPDDKEKHYMRGGQPGKFANKKNSIFPLNLYDPFGFNKGMSDEKREKRLIMEINNGRLAMIGIFGFLSEGTVEGSVPFLKGIIPHYDGNVMIPFEGDFTGYWG